MRPRAQRDAQLYNAGWERRRSSVATHRPRIERPLLTRRELEVLELLAAGLKRPAIADALCISQWTVRAHCSAIFDRLAVHCAAEAVAKGLREGLIR